MSKLELAKRNSKWVAQKPNDDANKIDQRQKDLWDGISNFCHERGGAIVSIKHIWPIRLETDPDSPLADKLRELGHDVVYREQTTRIGAPVSTRDGWRSDLNNGYSFHTRNVYELRLPK